MGPQADRSNIEFLLRRQQAKELIRTEQQGLGRPLVTAKFRDYQLVAAGNTVYYSKTWRFPADFLSDYLKGVLGEEWGKDELVKPFIDRHIILQWYDFYCQHQMTYEQRTDGTYVGRLTGIVCCYLGLAYNLFLLKHNVELQDRLLRRLKHQQQFQGAYYELIVANILIRAGFELALEDEADESLKHCEFSAISKRTRKKYWVEAKMRSEAGLLGKTLADGAPPGAKPTSRLMEHLRGALSKPAEDERLIFIDLNAPNPDQGTADTEQSEVPRWVEPAERQLRSRERDLKPGQQAYVFVTNLAFHRALDEEQKHSVLAYGLGISDFNKTGHFPIRELWRQEQKHVDAYDIIEAIRSYPKIPATFDGSMPNETAGDKIEIGGTYAFHDDDADYIVGTVETAMVSEQDWKCIIAIVATDGRRLIMKRDMTSQQIDNYKAHPDAFFGVVQKVSKKISDPYEFFKWLVNAYRNTPKDQLLKLCQDCEDFAELAQLDREELVLELCERWTASVVTRHGKEAPAAVEAAAASAFDPNDAGRP
jgi:hypothetical protein